MGHTWKNGLQLVKCVKLGYMGHTWKYGLHFEKWVRIVKCVTLG